MQRSNTHPPGSFRRQDRRSETTVRTWGSSCVVALFMAKTSLLFAMVSSVGFPGFVIGKIVS